MAPPTTLNQVFSRQDQEDQQNPEPEQFDPNSSEITRQHISSTQSPEVLPALGAVVGTSHGYKDQVTGPLENLGQQRDPISISSQEQTQIPINTVESNLEISSPEQTSTTTTTTTHGQNPNQRIDPRAQKGAPFIPQSSGSGGGAAQPAGIFGLLKALAKGSDEPLSEGEDEDDELSGSRRDRFHKGRSSMSGGLKRVMSPLGLGRHKTKGNNKHGGTGGERPEQRTNEDGNRPFKGTDENRQWDGKTGGERAEEAGTGTSRPGDRPGQDKTAGGHGEVDDDDDREGEGEGEDRGEWVGAIRESTKSNSKGNALMDTNKVEAKILIPSFYRTPTKDQDDLTHRLAILSVNNFSGLNSENNNAFVAADRESDGPETERVLSKGDLKMPELGENATEEEKERAEKELEEKKEHLVEEKMKEIQKSLQTEDVETLKSRLVPEEVLKGQPKEDDFEEREQHRQHQSESATQESELSSTTARPSTDDSERGTNVTKTGENDQDQEEEGEGDHFGESKMNKQDKIDAIIEEFGDLAGLMENSEPERLIAETRGALFRGIVIIGNIHLTSHRLTFHAMLPPPETSTEDNSQSSLLHSGPVTMHYKQTVFGSKTNRVWMELGRDMLTTYPDASEEGRVRPIRSILLGSIKQLYPMDPDHPFELRARYSVPKGEDLLHMSVDTEESALHWHRDLEAALWQHGRARRYHRRLAERAKERAGRPNAPSMSGQPVEDIEDGGWEMLRICLPLDRITEAGSEEFLEFARLLSLDVNVIDYATGSAPPFIDQEIDERERLFPDRSGSKSSTPSVSKAKSTEGEMSSTSSVRSGTSTPPFFQRFGGSGKGKGPTKNGSASSEASLPQAKDFAGSQEPTVLTDVSRRTSDTPSIERDAKPKTAVKAGRNPGAFRGPTSDPEDLTSTASIIPPLEGTIPDAEHPKKNTTINVKFGVLNERSTFADTFHETVKEARAANRKFKRGILRPMAVLDVGNTSLLELKAVEGGAGLRPDQMRQGSPQTRQKHARKQHSDGHESSSSSDDSDGNEIHRDNESKHLRQASKRRKAEKAIGVFGIPQGDTVWMKRCYMQRTVPFRGHMILSDRYFCFWRKTVGPINDIKMRYPTHDLQGASVLEESFRFGAKGLSVQVVGHHDLHFEFFSERARDETLDRINKLVADYKQQHAKQDGQEHADGEDEEEGDESGSTLPTAQQTQAAVNVVAMDEIAGQPMSDKEGESKRRAHHLLGLAAGSTIDLAIPDNAINHMPKIVNGGGAKQKIKPRTFALLTIGSRGDIQPYIALALGLMQDGHKVVIVTHDEFKNWVEGYGIEHRQAGGDPRALMKLSVEHKMFSPGFFKESLGNFRDWLDALLSDAYEACHDADVLIESPSAMAGLHVAEAYGIPYLRAFTMPWTRTSKYPHAFLPSQFDMGPGYNYSTYVLFDNILWKATSGQINRWRKHKLGLPATDLSHMSQTKVPFMYNFSTAVCPKPLDWHDDITITGYWFLENSDSDWSPPKELDEFMAKARKEGKPLVYIGFGSIVVPDPIEMTRNIIEAVDKAGVRAIIAKGWSSGEDDGEEKDDKEKEEPPKFSDNCYPLDKVPHGWLFPQVDAALHHGGAGTVGASLRAGVVTLIKPWFGDQYFWSSRVQGLGCGIRVNSLSSDDLAEALSTAVTDKVMQERAAKIGEKIRAENGVANAIAYIYRSIPRAGMDRTQLQWQKAPTKSAKKDEGDGSSSITKVKSQDSIL